MRFKHINMYFEYVCLIVLVFLPNKLIFWTWKRHALKNGAYTTNFQPVNSHLRPFYSFSVLGPARLALSQVDLALDFGPGTLKKNWKIISKIYQNVSNYLREFVYSRHPSFRRVWKGRSGGPGLGQLGRPTCLNYPSRMTLLFLCTGTGVESPTPQNPCAHRSNWTP